jgi:hypothetical protein
MQESNRTSGADSRIIRDQATRWNLTLRPLALIFALATAPLLFYAIARLIYRAADAEAKFVDVVIVAILAIVNAGLLAAALYVTVRARKFGRSHLELLSAPVGIGGAVLGTIVTGRPVTFTSPVRVALRCEERRITGDRGGNRSIVWQTEQAIDPPPSSSADTATRFPIKFMIPRDCPPTTHKSPYVTWRLTVHASMQGINYYATFRIPVVEA